MQNFVFLAICLFGLAYFQGIKGYSPPGCTCAKIPYTNSLYGQQFAFIAVVTHLNFIPHQPVPGYNSIVISMTKHCKGPVPYYGRARLNTVICPYNKHAFRHLKLYHEYLFYGTFKVINYRKSFIVDRCGPPCTLKYTHSCPTSLDQCHAYY